MAYYKDAWATFGQNATKQVSEQNLQAGPDDPDWLRMSSTDAGGNLRRPRIVPFEELRQKHEIKAKYSTFLKPFLFRKPGLVVGAGNSSSSSTHENNMPKYFSITPVRDLDDSIYGYFRSNASPKTGYFTAGCQAKSPCKNPAGDHLAIVLRVLVCDGPPSLDAIEEVSNPGGTVTKLTGKPPSRMREELAKEEEDEVDPKVELYIPSFITDDLVTDNPDSYITKEFDHLFYAVTMESYTPRTVKSRICPCTGNIQPCNRTQFKKDQVEEALGSENISENEREHWEKELKKLITEEAYASRVLYISDDNDSTAGDTGYKHPTKRTKPSRFIAPADSDETAPAPESSVELPVQDNAEPAAEAQSDN
ncbi:hypothetical protein BJ508DRAFT_340006 [Ascobolus immersus RN42]|uniref:Uncharacterized protein n=1 Tax=Ascobolus immersus RN42 TaxID=1160509 RepID=A0A3N4ISP7_ASCIM|nr:hypothetical protein BJ508DRAFT_340006 [Ascobolus immersus RN42]